MFRFIMMVLLMAACFFAGRISAQEEPIQFIVENVEQAIVSPQDVLALAQNQDLQQQFPELYGQLMTFLATPQIQAELVNPDRSYSPIYQRLAELVALINSSLNQEII